MIEIQLTRNQIALIDDIDQDLTKFNWNALPIGHSSSGWYASRNSPQVNKKRFPTILMHRVVLERILGRSLGKKEYTDHKNHDGLDNRRSNLRLANAYENHRNQTKTGALTSSRYKGVSWRGDSRRWRVCIGGGGRNQQQFVGYFKNEEEAAKAYDKAARDLFGEFANTNF